VLALLIAQNGEVVSMRHARRDILKLVAAAAAGSMVMPRMGLAAQPGPDFRRVKLSNLHTGEALDAVYWERGAYLPDALSAVNTVLRDFRTGDVHPIAPNLLDLLDGLRVSTGTAGPYHVISGYRSPRTNAMLASESHGVAHSSLHMQGMAIDIRLSDVSLSNLHRAALDLGRGGVGYYPESDFVHVDVGRVRRWG
jgi:uncharacterized protein YcbK (DUF882 family)